MPNHKTSTIETMKIGIRCALHKKWSNLMNKKNGGGGVNREQTRGEQIKTMNNI